MSQLWNVNITPLIEAHGVKRFVETGTGSGTGLQYAAHFPFTSLWSCEIAQVLVEYAQRFVQYDPRVKLFHGTSRQMLETLSDLPVDEPILFWLDAHFPGADFGLQAYDAEQDDAIRLPLADELSLIRALRPNHADVIAIDDARIWLDDEFGNGPVPENLRAACCAPVRNIDFIHDLYGATHTITVAHGQEGQIILTPR